MAKEKAVKAPADDFDKILDGLEKQFGDGNIFNGEEAALKDVFIQFDAPRLTWAYGGGFKLNAIHRFNGKESGGKTTLVTYIAGQVQRYHHKEDGNWDRCHVVILDNERSFDIKHARDLGLVITNPDTGKPLVHVFRNLYVDDQEIAFEKTVISGKVCCCIYDSDAAGMDKTSFGEVGYNDMSKATFGAGAKASGMVIKRMNYFVDRYVCPVLWISQERANQDIMARLPKPTGGEAVNFYPSTRFRVTPKDFITRNGETVGITMKIKNYKNKAILNGAPYRECLLDVYFKDGEDFKAGIDGEGQYFDMMLELGFIKQHGAWYYMNEDDPDPSKLVKMQGMGGVKDYFKEHRDEFLKIKSMVDEAMSGFNEILDKNSVQLDEEVEFQREQMELKVKREAQLKDLVEQAAAAAEGNSEEASA
mgnify:CR=1 FL=1